MEGEMLGVVFETDVAMEGEMLGVVFETDVSMEGYMFGALLVTNVHRRKTNCIKWQSYESY